MKRFRHLLYAAAVLASQTACTSAFAHRKHHKTDAVAVVPTTSPYTIDIVDDSGSPLPTYSSRGRLYVLGDNGDRYGVRITNPTGSRIEAVISIDGLDAVDGQPADYVSKRGYIVPPYGSITVEGFRTSMEDVATFRFSSVDDSYAGRKGVARNVGVIGVAIFAEKAQEPVYLPTPDPTPYQPNYGPEDETSAGEGGGGGDYRKAPAAKSSDHASHGGGAAPTGGATSAPPPPTTTASNAGASGGEEGGRDYDSSATRSESQPTEDRCGRCDENDDTDRPGLGTEYGEQRRSHVEYVAFERANASTPTVVAEIRYNDRAGLQALGIPLAPLPSDAEVQTRETANPFPESPYAQPPPAR